MNKTFNDTYAIKSIIGKGGMSTVYLAEHKRFHTRWALQQIIQGNTLYKVLAWGAGAA